MATIKLKEKSNNYNVGTHTQWNTSSFDGETWNGSYYDLFNRVFPTSSIFLINAFSKYPRVRFDFGNLNGHPEFEYIYIPTYYNSWTMIQYNVFALTNNKTILQRVGYIRFSETISTYTSSSNVAVSEIEPDENYTPASNND